MPPVELTIYLVGAASLDRIEDRKYERHAL